MTEPRELVTACNELLKTQRELFDTNAKLEAALLERDMQGQWQEAWQTACDQRDALQAKVDAIAEALRSHDAQLVKASSQHAAAHWFVDTVRGVINRTVAEALQTAMGRAAYSSMVDDARVSGYCPPIPPDYTDVDAWHRLTTDKMFWVARHWIRTGEVIRPTSDPTPPMDVWSGKPAEYKPDTPLAKIGYFVEEAGEALSALGKSLRMGFEGVHPKAKNPITNREWLKAELGDLGDRAIPILRELIAEAPDLTQAAPSSEDEP